MSFAGTSDTENVKVPLPQFLKLLANGNIPITKAIAIAGKIYKEYGTPAKLVLLTDVKLIAMGIEDPNDRKLVCAALQKAGYGTKRVALKRKKEEDGPVAYDEGSSRMSAVQTVTTPTKRRRRTQKKNNFMGEGPAAEGSDIGSLDFDEVMDEEILILHSTVINRAPIMTAWATIVAEQMNFKREEALSIASVYTEMNAISRGIALGLYNKGKEHDMEASRTGAQPFVEIMGRCIRPLYKTQNDQWRGLSNGTPVSPLTAFTYMSRSFRQTTPFIIGSLRLLAESYTTEELNKKAWALYTEFRPEVGQWGKRSPVSCLKILSLRKKRNISASSQTTIQATSVQPAITNETNEGEGSLARSILHQNQMLSLEDYEAALDQDTNFDDVDLDYEVTG